jgi:LPS export ABC transporter protein LptC
MAKRSQRLLLVALLALLAALLIRIALQSEKQHPTEATGKKMLPLARLENCNYTRTVGGEVQWQMQADEASYFQDANELLLQQVDGSIITPQRRLAVRGDQGRVDFKTHNGALEGSVVARSDDGYVLHTTRLEIEGDSRIIRTDEAVLIEGKNLTLQGIGMDIDLTRQTFALRQDVQATFGSGGGL